MPEPLLLRGGHADEMLVVVRLGATTLTDQKLVDQCARTFARWGLHGFSVLEVPDGDWQLLARLRPVVTTRRQVLTANAGTLRRAGFPLLPTQDHPHWTVVLSEPTVEQFGRVRALFQGPGPNPAWVGGR